MSLRPSAWPSPPRAPWLARLLQTPNLTIVSALIIGFLRNGLNLLDVSAFWQMIVIGVVIVVAVWIDVLRQRVGRAA